MVNNEINIFFASDDGYIPFLSVTLASIKKAASENRIYNITILNTGISEEYKRRISERFCSEKMHVSFFDLREEIDGLGDMLFTRDYYSKSTYYRLFIPRLFGNIDRALYLDCDTVLCRDVAELYSTELCGKVIGAASDGFVRCEARLHSYVMKRIGVKTPLDYFNAGVMLLDLERMRKMNFEDKFLKLIGSVKFRVAQDQDYLNAILKDNWKNVGCEWNCMPDFCECDRMGPALVHFNLDRKPWLKDGIKYSDIFWRFARESGFYEEIVALKNHGCDNHDCEPLIKMAEQEAENESECAAVREIISRTVTV